MNRPFQVFLNDQLLIVLKSIIVIIYTFLFIIYSFYFSFSFLIDYSARDDISQYKNCIEKINQKDMCAEKFNLRIHSWQN